MGQPKKRAATDGLRHMVMDEVRFLKNWLDKPLMTGAVAPSGPTLARLMASHVELDPPGLVLELGPRHRRRHPGADRARASPPTV